MVSAVLAAVATFLVTNQQVRDDQGRELRDKREPVYAEYVEAARALRSATGIFAMLCDAAREDALTAFYRCRGDAATYHAVVGRFGKARQSLSIYASAEAWAAAEAVAAELPGVATNAFADRTVHSVDALRFERALTWFRRAMCADLRISAEQICA